MACTCTSQSLAGLCKPCDGSIGGIVEVYIADYIEGAFVEDASAHTVSIATIASGATWYKYQFRKNTGSMTSTLNISDENGNSITTDVALSFSRMETKKRLEMVALSQKDLMAIVKDANGVFWALGKDAPINASAGTGETGTNRTDGNRYSITLEDFSKDWPFEIEKEDLPTITEGTN